jgi:putative ABC transport system substrate-binding protein
MIRRRDFITLLGGAAAWPLAAVAQQRVMIGYLSPVSAESDAAMLAAVRRGLKEMGYVEGENLAIEYRYSDGYLDRMPALAADLIGRRVAVIMWVGGILNGAVQGLQVSELLRTSQIPIVFMVGNDPVRLGLVASINRPGGTMTGVYNLSGDTLTAKQLGLLHDLVPSAKTIGLLDEPPLGPEVGEARAAAATVGLQLIVFEASTEDAIDAAFAAVNRQRPAAMVVDSGPFTRVRAKQIAALAIRYGVPAIYPRREYAEAGGLMSYGYDVADGYRWVGNYAGRILKGAKPSDLPVMQPTKFEFVINLKTAKAIELTVPTTLIGRADEVIE